MDMACAHCGARTPNMKTPSPGDMLFCVLCGGIAVWDESGGWRDMTKDEHRERLSHPGYLAAADHLMQMRVFVERDREAMTTIIARSLRGCVYPWLTTENIAADLATTLMRNGFHNSHAED